MLNHSNRSVCFLLIDFFVQFSTIQNPDKHYVPYSDESDIRVSGFQMVTVFECSHDQGDHIFIGIRTAHYGPEFEWLLEIQIEILYHKNFKPGI